MNKKTTLDNGLRIVSEKVGHVKSVSVGIWVNIGSRDETNQEAGYSHFVEHMIFKGTDRRSALDIAKEIDSVGGMANAFTSKEYTCFHAKVMSDHLPGVTDLLSDIFLNSSFSEEDIERERQVILQEVNMVEDTPDEHIHVLFGENFWPGAPLGRSVLGTTETIMGITRDSLFEYLKTHYLPHKIIIAAVGEVEHDEFTAMINTAFESLPAVKDNLVRVPPEVKTGISVTSKDLEQVHLCMGVPFPTVLDEERYTAAILHTMLGGNMSSRLFQEIRENRGLAYSIYSFLSTYMDAGLLGVYAGIGPEKVQETVGLILKELAGFRDQRVTEAEMISAREHIKGGIVLSLESTDNLMTRLAKSEITYNRYVSFEEVMSAIDKVTADQIQALAQRYFNDNDLALTVLGPVADEDFPENGLTLG